MAAVHGAVQMITRDSQNRGIDRHFMRREVQNLIDEWDSKAPADSRYTIVSVIGPQSTGKSTLLNRIFKAGFKVLSSNCLRTQTTQGIWVTVCDHPRAIVIDTEGSDGIEQQDDIGFENQSALFALLMSDLIIINLWEKDINRLHAGFNTKLTTIFQEIMTNDHMAHRMKIMFAVRDYGGQGTYLDIMNHFNGRVNEIWSRIPQNGNLTLTDYVEVHVELFPSAFASQTLEEFEEKCAALRDRLAGGEFGHDIQNLLPAKKFPTNAADLWEKILRNERLHFPSHKVLMARQNCESIMKEILQNDSATFLQADDRSSPKLFLIALENNKRHILSQYERATSTYDCDTAEEIKEKLERSFIEKNKPAFQRTLERERQKFLKKIKKEIAAQMKYSLMPNNLVQPSVEKYTIQFDNSIIADLDCYHKEITKQKQEFLHDMTCFAKQKAAEIVAERWAVFKKAMIGAAAIGASAFALYCFVKFGASVAATVVAAMRSRSFWNFIANVTHEATTSSRSDTVNKSIDIVHGATSADKNMVALFVILGLAVAKEIIKNSQVTPEGA